MSSIKGSDLLNEIISYVDPKKGFYQCVIIGETPIYTHKNRYSPEVTWSNSSYNVVYLPINEIRKSMKKSIKELQSTWFIDDITCEGEATTIRVSGFQGWNNYKTKFYRMYDDVYDECDIINLMEMFKEVKKEYILESIKSLKRSYDEIS